MLFYPEKIALLGILFYTALWIISPLEIVFPFTGKAPTYISACYAAFWLGCFLGAMTIKPKPHLKQEFRSVAFKITAILGAAGMALRIFDKLFIRGINLAEGALESRELLEATEASPISALGGILFPFCYIPLIIWWGGKEGPDRSKKKLAIALMIFSLPGIDALSLLSRSQMLIALTTMYFAGSCNLFQGRPLAKKLITPMLAGIVTILVATILVFSSRLDQMDLELLTSILSSAYGYTLTPNASALKIIDDGGLSGSLLQSTIPIAQYYLHGLFELDVHLNNTIHQNFTLGAQTFGPYVKVLNIFNITDTPKIDYESIYYRVGVFTTFFGPVWTDFGWAGIPFTFAFGFIAKHISIQAKSGNLGSIPLHCYLSAIIFFMPAINFMISATGMYAITAFALFWMAIKPSRLNNKIRSKDY